MWRLLLPGVKIKRFLFLMALGFLALGVAVGRLLDYPPVIIALTVVFAGTGIVLVIIGGWGLWNVVGDVIGSEKWAPLLYSRRQLARGPKVVALGGGTGLPVVLRGVKQYTSNLTAVVTVADDGGSSGRLRGELGMLPPGDIRNCMVALADTEPLMEELFQHRFQTGELKGHSFGNLFLAAMEQVAGDFVTALRESSRVLAVRGTVLPATLDRVTLWAELEDGRKIYGESNIGQSPAPIKKIGMDPMDATPLAEAVTAIMQADMVVMGPGSLYTSVIPNLLVRPIYEAIRSTRAIRVFVTNVMTQPGETTHYSAQDHLAALDRQIGRGLVDVVLVNNQPVEPEVLQKYVEEGAEVVRIGESRLAWPEVVQEPLLAMDGFVRHDPDKLARALLRIMQRHRTKWAEGHMLDGLVLEARLRERLGHR